MNNDEKILKSKEKATLTIAYTLLFTFVGSVIFFAVITAVSASKGETQSKAYENWMALFKDSLILIATALTTIIGYYFGQRESTQAYREAAEAKAVLPEAEKIITRLKEEVDRKVGTESFANDSEDFRKIRNK